MGLEVDLGHARVVHNDGAKPDEQVKGWNLSP